MATELLFKKVGSMANTALFRPTIGIFVVVGMVGIVGGYGCGDTQIASVNNPPIVDILSPATGTEHRTDFPLDLLATVRDRNDREDDILVTVTSNIQDPALVGQGSPNIDEIFEISIEGLSEGLHTLTVTASDREGESHSDSIEVMMVAPAPPAVTILSPVDGYEYDIGTTIIFEAEISDDLDAPDTLLVSWTSDLVVDPLNVDAADGNGFLTFAMDTLGVGTHRIDLFVTDSEMMIGQDTVFIDLIDPGDLDRDGDGWTPNMGDCDDFDAAVNPAAVEFCDGADSDCDGNLPADEVDGDGDGQPPCLGDCDDADPFNFLGNAEICDGQDNDCNGLANFDPQGEVDADGDLFRTCNGDCDDSDPDNWPGNLEYCDGADNNCDGVVPADEVDGDNDGQLICEGDCDDADPLNFLGNPEVCDGQDNDCNLIADFDPAGEIDVDSDGWPTCADDCNDTDPTVNPGAPEICDTLDNDCDGLINEDFAGPYERWETSFNSPGYSLGGINPDVVFGNCACTFPDPFFGLPLCLVNGTESVGGVFSAPNDLFDVYTFSTDFLSGAISLAAFMQSAGSMPAQCFMGSVTFSAALPIRVTVLVDGTPHVATGTSGAVNFTLNIFQLFGIDYRVVVEPLAPWNNCNYSYNLQFNIP